MSPFDLQSIERSIASHDLRSCLVLKQGQYVLEYYREPEITSQIHKINSCTKSILSALIGIAIDQGKIQGTSTPIHHYYPEVLQDHDSRKHQITIEHLLAMTSGWEWSEFGGINSFPRMTKTAHWLQFALEQPMADVPGERMVYNSGCSQLLAGILMQTTGMPVSKFAEQHLFGPLGVEDYLWEVDPQGIHTGGFGLSLKPSDMVKFGQLFLQRGAWKGRQLLSSNWVQQSTQPRIQANKPREGFYGWHWWVSSFQTDEQPAQDVPYYFALGFGGQYIIVVPSHDLVAVLTNDKHKKRKPPLDLFLQYIAPALRK
ncbi:serine hydrolase [Paenibacillus selenitireducens]|uniref:Serine hydrolase n=1 Tax=Paenibacillus selenitireducens TaxID=1324314 RepID=A0A1T2X363_9BACL|nr:serine hydrolase [Paenibacillus selenitireducens]OPA74300.1 serine hydrolase [Paenibacillus selenitireducens]